MTLKDTHTIVLPLPQLEPQLQLSTPPLCNSRHILFPLSLNAVHPFFCVVLSYVVLSCRVLPCVVLCCVVLCCLVLSCLVLCCLILFILNFQVEKQVRSLKRRARSNLLKDRIDDPEDNVKYLVFPVEENSPDAIEIYRGDLKRLKAPQYLNDSLIDLKIKLIIKELPEEKRIKVRIFFDFFCHICWIFV